MKVPSGTPNCSTCQVFAKMRRPGVSLNIWLALQRVVSGSQPTSCPAWVKCCGMITGVAAVPQLWVQKTCNSTTWGVCKKYWKKPPTIMGNKSQDSSPCSMEKKVHAWRFHSGMGNMKEIESKCLLKFLQFTR